MADEARRDVVQAQPRGAKNRVLGRFAAPFSSLSIRNYRYLWFGQVGSAVGMHADMLARGWLTHEMTGSNAQVGAVMLMRSLPMLIFGLGGGVIADRFDRRRLLIIIQVWTMLAHVLMAALILSGVVVLWHVYAVAFLLGIGMAMNQPVRTTMIPEVVGKKHMLNAIALNSLAINSTRFIGPAAIAFVIAEWGVGYAYVVSALAYAAVIWSTIKIRVDLSAIGRKTTSMASQFAEGLRYIARQRMILSLVLLGLGPLSFGLAHRTLLPGLVDERLGGDVRILGFLSSAAAIGSIAGALILGARGTIRGRGPLMLVMTVTYGVALALLAAPVILWAVYALMIVAGVSQTVFRTANTSVLLERTPDQLRGRVMSVVMLDNALAPVAGLAAGLIADGVGIGSGFLFLGIACLVVVAMALAFYPRLIKT